MNRTSAVRFSKYLFAAAALSSAAFVAWKWVELNSAANRIVERYPDQIKALTQFLIDRPSFDIQDEQWEAEEASRQRLAMEFADDAFDDVSISDDGHHGIVVIKPHRNVGKGMIWTNFTPFAVQGAQPGHRVSFGQSSAGEKFYVYDARIPEAKYVRHFQFWIPRSLLH